MLYHWNDRFRWLTKHLTVGVLNWYLMVITNDKSKKATLKFGATH